MVLLWYFKRKARQNDNGSIEAVFSPREVSREVRIIAALEIRECK